MKKLLFWIEEITPHAPSICTEAPSFHTEWIIKNYCTWAKKQFLTHFLQSGAWFFINSLFFYSIGCRGGIQFTFPYFANHINGPKHGFARYVPWTLEEGPVTLKDGNVQALFSLQESEYTKAIWNYKFKISFRVSYF